jgi:hypothetical protein
MVKKAKTADAAADAATDAAAEPVIYHVPATVAEMRQPKASSLITEAANFLRAHWEEVKPYYLCISGEAPSMHGRVWLDEAACVFEVKRIATANGFAFLGSVPTNKLRTALRFGFKRNTGTPMRQLEKQYRRLQITHQQPQQQP